ncbi:MAG TPA: flagellin [Phycisphaeraceae bacterium]
MSRITPMFARPTSLMVSDQLLSRLRATQRQLLEAQVQITTGKRYNRPSDAPAHAGAILFLNRQLAVSEQYAQNLQQALSALNNMDAALSEAHDIALEAKTTAQSQIGVGSDAQTRQTTSLVIDAHIQSLIDLANRQFNQRPLFGGNAGAAEDQPIFEAFLGGVRYRGSRQSLQGDTGVTGGHLIGASGTDVFGALSARIESTVDLNPLASADTRISDLNGAQLQGVRKGSVRLTVNGASADVDLSNADTLNDVLTRINAAITAIDPAAGSLAITGGAFELTANAGHTIAIQDIGSGQTAADLGITLTAAGGVAAGSDLNRRLTELTRLSDLGVAIDWASGLYITQGSQTQVADFSTAQTIQDLQNVIEQLNLGLRLEINEQADGLNLVSEVSGIRLSVGENGGTTAQDLGLRSFGLDTRLDEFRDGLGVENIEGEADFAVTLHDGTTFQVDIDGVTTVQELITAIETAAAGAGVTVGVDFAVSLASVGNGLVFQDNTAGAEEFRIENVGLSVAADHLGIAKNVGSGATLQGDDNASVRVENIFTHLIDLRDALANNDESGITLAGSRVEQDLDTLVRSRAAVGVEAQQVQQEQQRLEERQLMEKSMLSELQDADVAEVITRFTQLQQQLQASLQAGAQNLLTTLLDYLR